MLVTGFCVSALSLISLAEANTIRKTIPSPNAILDEALKALGGERAIKKLTGVTYEAPNQFRSRSLMQSYDFDRADIGVAITGSQNISFQLNSGELQQRIDRRFVPSDYWIWASPKLDLFDFSLVVRGGDDGYACYVKGNNQIWLPPDLASGYTDCMLNSFLTVHDSSSDITVIMHSKTKVPYIVRTWEDHPVFGRSTSDLYLTGYKAVHGIQFPHNIQTVYNATSQHINAVLEDFIVENITLNPHFSKRFFDGISEDKSFAPRAAPKKAPGVSHAIIGEFNSNMLGSGFKNDTVEDLIVETPLADLPFVHWLRFDNETLGVKQMILEFENEVIICDAPPQWTKVVIEWVAMNIKKPITHVWPTHHHRDHAGGVDEYVAIGAKLIVPQMAVSHWSSIPGATFVTFNDTHPFVYSDNKIQAWFMWQHQTTHASDWSYAVITEKCPTAKSPVVALEADVWQAGVSAGESDQALMRQWLDQVLGDGLTDKAIVFPTHGQVTPLTELIEITGYPYPSLGVADWQHGKACCK
ncbi:hypothetical protein B0T10DRAFT_412091 [Thelonectria olida]|uniref:Metallo-beta-lactamase domain-containing protein n=1 Tax=Thelonectria olida TaxID=1576542 RepID=A0A9P8VWP6_9HYPO|nr:hypothetical protein B0T10DRAFT_412091 [Thelonectria olida]